MICRSNSASLLSAVLVLLTLVGFAIPWAATASEREGTMESKPGEYDAVVIGASYAAGWKVENLAGLTFVNKGVGGQESSQMLARFERDVVALKPRYVIIWGFINDIFRAERADLAVRVAGTKNDLKAMVESARDSGIKPILATEVTTAEPAGMMNSLRGFIGRLRGKQSYARFVSNEVTAVNDWMRSYASEHAIPLLDIEQLFADEDGLRKRDYTAEDGSHITEVGYRTLTEYAERHLPELIAR